MKALNQNVKIKRVDHEKIQEGQTIYFYKGKGQLWDSNGKKIGPVPCIEKEYPILEWTLYAREGISGIDVLEQEWRKNQPRYSPKELSEIFPGAEEAIREQILETSDKLLDARFRILNSYWHSLREKEAKPICEAAAELIWENELQPLERKLKRLIWQYGSITAPENIKPFNRIDAEKVKASADLKEVVENYGVKLRRVGKYWVGLCPFHPDKQPSFFIYPNNTFHCYGCRAHGDVFTFIELKEGLNFKQALEVLAQNYHG